MRAPETASGEEPFPQPAGSDARDVLVVGAIVGVLLGAAGSAVIIGSIGAWVLALILAIALGRLLGRDGLHLLVMSALPATLLTGTAVVPSEGRYIPAMVVFGAILVASRGGWTAVASAARRSLPTILQVVVAAYLLWGLVVTATSESIATGIQYLGGSVVSLAVALAVTPLVILGGRGRQFMAAVALLGLAFVASGLVLFALRGVQVFGKELGLYFIGELAVAGLRTGFVFPQNYGPFVGPSTEVLAFAVVAGVYLALTSRATMRTVWIVSILVSGTALLASFSREGVLMAAIGCGGVGIGMLPKRRAALAALATSGALSAFALAASFGAVGIVGRLDLVSDWYGGTSVAVLMNPDVTERGSEPGPEAPATEYPEVVDLKTQSSFEARLSLWRAALGAAAERPILGYGMGWNAEAIRPYLNGEDARLRGAQTHSTVFRVLVEMGVPGLVLYLAFCLISGLVALRLIFRRATGARLFAAACIGAILFHQLIGTLLLGGLSFGSYFFAVTVGLAVFNASRESMQALRPPQLRDAPA